MANPLYLAIELPDEYVNSLVGTELTGDHYRPDLLIQEDRDVYRPNGSLFAVFRKRTIPLEVSDGALPTFLKAARGNPASRKDASAGGNPPPGAKHGLIGSIDPDRNSDDCRVTRYTRDDLEGWLAVQEFVVAAARVYREAAPKQYRAQKKAADQIPRWVFPFTPFTALSVNRDWPTTAHRDLGDFKAGFAVTSVIKVGDVEGCYTGWPKFRLAFDIETGDVLCADVHEVHGNTALKRPPGATRIATILYLRTAMLNCDK